ncbi:AAA family ATPase [Psychrobacter urativorans]|uniref:AAA family ATPase n=1 Tax=Psychrobacter urativorans TaxID=45610 RepID=UPI001919CE7D|nr:ATP-binding protein [Psychrobacter urativorans]
MLIEFTVKNYRSIKEEQTLSMVKNNGEELETTNSFIPETHSSIPLLRSAVIYGANAAGKSNVIKAIMTMESIIRDSASASQEGDDIGVTPFLFNSQSSNEPTLFEMIFISENVKYQYGFSTTNSKIVSEWLFAFPKGVAQTWFERLYNEDTKKHDFKFGKLLKGQKVIWQDATRDNALFLSTAVQLNSEQLKPVFNWFKSVLRPTRTSGYGLGFTASLCDSENKDKVLEFLNSADFSIHDIEVEKEKFTADLLPDNLPSLFKEEIVDRMKDKEVIELKAVHKTEEGKLVSLDFDEESDGTQKFFSFVGPWIDSLEKGYVLVIDELHNNLHPKMVKYLVDLFNNSQTNPKNAQLIFSTHETSILSQKVFRRDQVWFCEKDTSQATRLYPLTDFHIRKDKINLEFAYLDGLYGALPFIQPLTLNQEV